MGVPAKGSDENVLEVIEVVVNEGNGQKVVKEILKYGQGGETPVDGDTVRVDYTGTLQETGEEFDSSRRPGREPFKFALGKGSVIKGWDVGVATMQRGERARLIIDPDYGYGESGSPPSIPGNATLVFDVELLDWKEAADITEDGDGGVKKYVEKAGEGWGTPKPQDELLVVFESDTYTTKNGECDVFELEKGVPVQEFTEGMRHALEMVLKTMKKGEEARVVVSKAYHNADFEEPITCRVSLKDWHKVEYVTPDQKIQKKSLNSIDDWKHPNAGATVKVAYVGRLADGTVFDERKVENPLEFVTDEEQCPCEGLELAIMKMKVGEHCLVTIPPEYAFGAGSQQALHDVPSDATVTYDITLLDMENAKETWDMTEAEKVGAAQALKEKGNAAFKSGKIPRAIALWERSKKCVEMNDNFGGENKSDAKMILKSLQLNSAAAYLKVSEPAKAREAASKVLEHDPYNMKALYRRAQSYIDTKDWVEAAQDIKLALGNEPNNTDFRVLAKRLKLAEAKSVSQEKSLWGATFAKLEKEAKKERELELAQQEKNEKEENPETVAA